VGKVNEQLALTALFQPVKWRAPRGLGMHPRSSSLGTWGVTGQVPSGWYHFVCREHSLLHWFLDYAGKCCSVRRN